MKKRKCKYILIQASDVPKCSYGGAVLGMCEPGAAYCLALPDEQERARQTIARYHENRIQSLEVK